MSIEQFLNSYSESYPIDNSIALSSFDEKSIESIIAKLKDRNIAELLKVGDREVCKSILKHIEFGRIISVLNEMKTDDVVDVMGLMNVDIRKILLNEIKNNELSSVESLLGYKTDSAGGIMTTEYITLNENMSIEEAYLKVCKIAPKSEVVEDLYVVNSNNKLVGKINIRDILVSERTQILTTIMSKKVITVTPEVDQEEVAKLVSKYDLVAVPVISSDGIVLGVITLDDIIDVIYQEQAEDLLNIGGVSKAESIKKKAVLSISQRLPWQLVNLGTVFFAAFVVSAFESEIERIVALAIAMPIIAGMGGNSGNQVLAMTIRNLTYDDSNIAEKMYMRILKEIFIGLINGGILGSSAGFIIYLRYEEFALSIIVGVAMVCNFIVANIAGLLIPTILKKMKLDPAVGSSILVTAITDSFGFFILLTLARMLMRFM